MVFPYRALDGRLLGYVFRVEFDDGKKVTPTVRFVRLPDGREVWATVPFEKPRPLYWADARGGQVVVTEGEKAADAAARLLGNIAVATWPGGTQGVKYADWSVLAGRSVVIWPDADEPGREAARDIADRLLAIGATVKVAEPEDNRPAGWDAADAEAEGWDRAKTLGWLKVRCVVIEPTQPETEPPPHEGYNEGPADDEPDIDEPLPPAPPIDEGENAPFRVLGYDSGHYFYLPRATQQVAALPAQSHTWKNLMQLAPSHWWEANFQAMNKAGEMAATAALLAKAHAVGPFFPERLHGRGAWRDGERVIYHLGDKALTPDGTRRLYEVEGEAIYQATRPIRGLDLETMPATSQECQALVGICKRLPWANPLSGVALAGWIAIAPICGALKWRPHIWITGGAGSGKSTVMMDVVMRLLQSFAVQFEGNTSEAGIRQKLGTDALPIVFDEAEAETERAQGRIGAIVDLARLASSGARVVKGSKSGEAVEFTVRSAFCFSSIEHSIKQHADETRISKLALVRRTDAHADEEYKAMMSDIRNLFTPKFASSLFLRIWHNIPTVLDNIAVCIDAAAQELRDRRAADQVGTLIGGYVSLHMTRPIEFKEAVEFVRRYDWSEHTAIASADDKTRLLERILTFSVAVTTEAGKNMRVTIADMLRAARSMHGGIIPQSDAVRLLGPMGIKVDDDGAIISATSQRFSREILRGSQWEADWSRPLRELKGARKANVTYFAAGVRARGTLIPWETIGLDETLDDMAGALV
jgi:putative DNA primase/helicase